MTSLRQIMSALEDVLVRAGMRVVQGVPDSIVPPIVVIGLPVTIEYDLTMGRCADTYTMSLLLLVGRHAERATHLLLADMLDAGPASSSLKATVATDPTLGGVVDDARITRATEVGSYTVGGVEYLGARLECGVVA